MKTIISTILISFFFNLLTFSQENNNDQLYTLRGKITGQNSGKVILKYVVFNKYKRDTAILRNGKFIFQGNISEPKAADITMGNDLNTAHIYIEPGEMKISLTKDKFKEFKMTGSKTQDEASEYNLLIAPISKKRDVVFERFDALRDSLSKTTNEDSLAEKLPNLKEYKQLSQLNNQLNSINLQFIKSHPQSYLSADLLRPFDKNEVISLDSLKSIYHKFDINIQNSTNGKEIKKDIIKKENIRIGAAAPDFKAKDINNQLVTLSEFKGKNVVLMDFWASYCVYCRQAFPHLKDVYRKYHSKGLEIIGVSTDLDRKSWISAVNHDSINLWHHVPVAEKFAEGPSKITKDDIYENYFVQGIPVLLLIDKNGKIIGRWDSSDKEDEESLDKQLAEVFKEK